MRPLSRVYRSHFGDAEKAVFRKHNDQMLLHLGYEAREDW